MYINLLNLVRCATTAATTRRRRRRDGGPAVLGTVVANVTLLRVRQVQLVLGPSCMIIPMCVVLMLNSEQLRH